VKRLLLLCALFLMAAAAPPGCAQEGSSGANGWTPDWGGSTWAWWSFDQPDGARFAEPMSGGCTHGAGLCDLTRVNDPSSDTVHFQQGMASQHFVGDGDSEFPDQYFRCNFADCAPSSATVGLNKSDQDFTFGAWVRPEAGSGGTWFINSKSDSTTGGYQAQFSNAAGNPDKTICRINDSGNNPTTATGTATPALDTWLHVACRVYAGNVALYENGVLQATAAGTYAAANGTVWAVGGDATQADLIGSMDEVFFFNTAISDASICRVCSCGIEGRLCTCDVTDPTAYRACTVDGDCRAPSTCDGSFCRGRRVSACGSCTITATCNQAAPS